MGIIQIRFSDNMTSDQVIYELMKIEEDVYKPEYRGEYEAICKRFRRYREMFVLAYDGNKIIGYLCYFPVSHGMHEAILSEGAFHDDDIQPEDVMPLGDKNEIYILSTALYKSYHGKGIGRAMMNAFLHKMKEEKEKGREIRDIIASVVTEQGERVAREFGFELVKDYSNTARISPFGLLTVKLLHR